MKKNIITKPVSEIVPSATEETFFLANQLKKQGIDIIDFVQGEPDFDTPDHIKQAAIEAINAGFTKYTDIYGIPELREAVADKLKRENNVEYEVDQIIITSGAKSALYEIFRCLCEQKDQVLIPAPCYLSYEGQIKLTGAELITFETKEENNFRPTLAEVAANITPNVKLFIINSPCNPTGSVVDQDELAKIAKFLVDRGVYMISDEVYEHLIYDDRKAISVASLGDREKEMSITVNSVSKTYAMTGWRIGYVAGPKEIITAINNIQGHAVGNANSIAQKAAIEALRGNQQPVKDRLKVYTERRAYMVERFRNMEDITCHYPDGAFYTLPKVTGLYGRIYGGKSLKNDLDVTKFLLEKAHVAAVPGVTFGAEGYIRFVFAKSMEEIKEGMDRIEKAIHELN